MAINGGDRLPASTLADAVLVGTVVAQLRRTTTQATASGVVTPIQWDTEDYDLLNGHSTVTNTSRYTCMKEGWYQLIGGVGFDFVAGGNYRACNWLQNGVNLNGGQQLIPPVAASFGTVVSARPYMTYMVVGDYVELGAQQNAGAVNISGTTVLQPTMQLMYAGLPT